VTEYSDEEFVGYIFQGPPERRSRLWFLQRHLDTLFIMDGWAIDGENGGVWKAVRRGFNPVKIGPCIRYDSESWSAVWCLTAVTIPNDPNDAGRGFGITTFGRDDDVWRLGLWPD
jgi:hypothetical protein